MGKWIIGAVICALLFVQMGHAKKTEWLVVYDEAKVARVSLNLTMLKKHKEIYTILHRKYDRSGCLVRDLENAVLKTKLEEKEHYALNLFIGLVRKNSDRPYEIITRP